MDYLPQLAENLFLQLGLMDIPQVGCGEAGGCLSSSSPWALCPNKTDSGSVHACDCSMPPTRAPGSLHSGWAPHTAWSPLERP